MQNYSITFIEFAQNSEKSSPVNDHVNCTISIKKGCIDLNDLWKSHDNEDKWIHPPSNTMQVKE